MILRRLTDWQQEVIDATKQGSYLEYPNQPTPSSTKYQTRTGVDFIWYHSIGDGKGITIMGEWQPRSVAKAVRKKLAKDYV